MNKFIILLSLLYSLVFIQAIDLKVKIQNFPTEIDQLSQIFKSKIPNLGNSNRIKAQLYKLPKNTNKFKNINFHPIDQPVIDKNYQFNLKNLQNDENYQLIIDSYDFEFEINRFKLNVSNDEVQVYEDKLGSLTPNKTSLVSVNEPLIISIKSSINYYENSNNAIVDMIMNSPFGFIFRNKTYTIIFIFCLCLMLAPYIAEWISPEFAAQFKDVPIQDAFKTLEQRQDAKKSKEVNKSGDDIDRFLSGGGVESVVDEKNVVVTGRKTGNKSGVRKR
ncbi:hypothetical protein KGF54_004252 [Candida jiufengensis]|uniref:uncharacterized protein n=1 Tax=Candida jiufengensis TaxID=497108 RepID=UPI00222425E0|nr:uncharacterized protein KGF54_004252 [Candida jiufengensis]KAI5951178.1 hypothetical protein KGF54_004252 [Candida jiufengensis]